jgi:hypothetical protein
VLQHLNTQGRLYEQLCACICCRAPAMLHAGDASRPAGARRREAVVQAVLLGDGAPVVDLRQARRRAHKRSNREMAMLLQGKQGATHGWSVITANPGLTLEGMRKDSGCLRMLWLPSGSPNQAAILGQTWASRSDFAQVPVRKT